MQYGRDIGFSTLIRENNGICKGIVPFGRFLDFWGFGVGGIIETKKGVSVRTQAGAIRQTGRNVFATCGFRSPSDGWHITHTERYREWGAFGSVEVNYPFPKKDRERIRKERYVIGLNGIYSHLSNEVDHYAYGLHVGFNFLYKKG